MHTRTTWNWIQYSLNHITQSYCYYGSASLPKWPQKQSKSIYSLKLSWRSILLDPLVFNGYRPFSGGVASRLATAIYVATSYMTILIVQMTQISNMKVISLVVNFLKIIKLWHLSIEFYGECMAKSCHALTIELNT